MLATKLDWSLHDIDRTDIFSLLRFVARKRAADGAGAGPDAPSPRAYADQVSWL